MKKGSDRSPSPGEALCALEHGGDEPSCLEGRCIAGVDMGWYLRQHHLVDAVKQANRTLDVVSPDLAPLPLPFCKNFVVSGEANREGRDNQPQFLDIDHRGVHSENVVVDHGRVDVPVADDRSNLEGLRDGLGSQAESAQVVQEPSVVVLATVVSFPELCDGLHWSLDQGSPEECSQLCADRCLAAVVPRLKHHKWMLWRSRCYHGTPPCARC